MSSPFPFDVASDPFIKDVRGVYGVFKTNESYETCFVLASIPIERIGDLSTASEAFDIKSARFADLVQRDIDKSRVSEIVTEYLLRGKDKGVIFFPPLLVSLVSFDDPDLVETTQQISDYYRTITEIVNEKGPTKTIVKTWDTNRFQLELPIATTDTRAFASCNDIRYPIYEFGAKLRYNPTHVKLVVVDGQHRLSALRRLYNDAAHRKVVSSIVIPVCIAFSPNPLEQNQTGERIRNNLRNLFITINKTAKEVSGHFLILLNDKSLSSLAVRAVAQALKNDDSRGYPLLHFLEWNQHEARRANQLTRKYSITTVSVMADALRAEVFDRRAELTVIFLNLEAVRPDLEIDDDMPSVAGINEESFHPRQLDILEKQISQYISPAIISLFLRPRPYAQQVESFGHALRWLDDEVTRGAEGAQYFRDDVLGQFRQFGELDPPEVEAIQTQFYGKTSHSDADEPFFLNIFQHGLIRAWVQVARIGLRFELSPALTAAALVPALDCICFAAKKKLFVAQSEFTQLALYRDGGSVIATEASRKQCMRLILATLGNDKARSLLTEGACAKLSPKARADFDQNILEVAKAAIVDYRTALSKAVQDDYERNWYDRELGGQRSEFEALRDSAGEASDQFREHLESKLTKPRIKRAMKKLTGVMEWEVTEP